MSKRHWLFVVIVCCIAQPVLACLWDHDTLQMERSRFPDVLELITGKFLRHSKAFYEWRITDRSARIENGESTKELYDDLAVAYDKTGQHDKAVETIKRKDELWPGLYETLANHGTFLIHSGKLEDGVKLIRKAIEVNPDAHFGREVYQQLLVEYVLERKLDGKTMLPLGARRKKEDGSILRGSSFADFLFKKQKVDYKDREAERKKALKGIMGMMRFGNFESPVLLETLADLLMDEGMPKDDGKWLAARAYLKAAYETDDDETVSAAYQMKARFAIKLHEHANIKSVARKFDEELMAANNWWVSVSNDEEKWIEAGVDVDAEFSKEYFRKLVSAESIQRERTTAASALSKRYKVLGAVSVCCIISVIAFFIAIRASSDEDGE